MGKIIETISIVNYRGFKDEQSFQMAEHGNMTFLVGQNNSGKTLISKVLAFVNKIQHSENEAIPNVIFEKMEVTDHEFHNLFTSDPIIFKIGFSTESIISIVQWMKVNFPHFNYDKLEDRLNKLTLIIRIIKSNNTFKVFSFISNAGVDSFIFSDRIDESSFNTTFTTLFQVSADISRRITKRLIELLQNSFLIFSPIRSFHESDTSFSSGSEILTFLGFNDNESEKKNLKNLVHKYLKKLNLEVPYHVDLGRGRQLNFTFNDSLQLSTNDVGTGYTMVYILLMEIFRNRKKIIVVDEVESHLHPGLIRELIRIFREIATDQQFIISTHSPTVMESACSEDKLYHFQKTNGHCVIRKFFKNDDLTKGLRSVGNDLGIVPGDALLANCVIWVEGATELLWLRAWLKQYLSRYQKQKNKTSNLLEGLHYSILMTGGSLISNLYFDEVNKTLYDIEEDFGLQVLRVNPNAFVIIDSDNSSVDSAKFKRCLRIAKELNDQNMVSVNEIEKIDIVSSDNIRNVPNLWLLQGREIENYCHPDLLRKFYEEKMRRPNSNVKVNAITDWSVFSETDGVGKILTKRGAEGVQKEKSETIIHKMDLASFIFNNLKEEHFDLVSDKLSMLDKNMIADLNKNLSKICDYIFLVNNLS